MDDMTEPQKTSSPAIAAAIILVVAGIAFAFLPRLMLWLGNFSPWLAVRSARSSCSPSSSSSGCGRAISAGAGFERLSGLDLKGGAQQQQTHDHHQRCAGNLDRIADAPGRDRR